LLKTSDLRNVSSIETGDRALWWPPNWLWSPSYAPMVISFCV